ncbi:MAG: SusC/RagA family TonB-linked outer membrane protein [Bacteroidota bacterium]
MSNLLDSVRLDFTIGTGDLLQNREQLYPSWGDITRLPQNQFSTPQSAWQGQFSGLRVQATTGELDANFRLRIRGERTVWAFGEPLLVVDGLPIWQTPLVLPDNAMTNPLLFFPSDAFTQVDVIKDGLSTYGARGANGVISLSTRPEDVSTGTNFRVSYRAGITQSTVRPEMLSAAEFDELFVETLQNSGADEAQILFQKQRNNVNDSTDSEWARLPYRTGFFQQAVVSVSHRDSTGYRLAEVGFRRESSHVIFHNQQRPHARVQTQDQISSRLSLRTNLGATILETDRLDNIKNPLLLIFQIPSNLAYDPETGEPYTLNRNYNTLLEENGTQNQRRVVRIIQTSRAEYQLTDWLSAALETGFDFTRQREDVSHDPTTIRGGTEGLSYQRKVQAATARGGLSIFGTRNLNKHTLRYSTSADYQYYDLDTYRTRISRPTNARLEQAERYAFGGFNATLHYGFDRRYLLQVNYRYERATTFGRQNPWQGFGSLAAGWTISHEPFFQPIIDKVSFLQLRASWDESGNGLFDPALAQGSLTQIAYGDEPALSPRTLGNDALRPERTQQLNFGLKAGFYHDKIFLEVNHFRQTTDGLIRNVSIPATSGYDNQWQNKGEIQNEGWEFTLRTHNYDRFWDWFTEVNFSLLNNQVTDLDGESLLSLREGEAYGNFFGIEYAGVDTQTGDALYRTEDGGTTSNPAQAEIRSLGQRMPKFWGGIRNRFEYEWLTVDLLVEGAGGNYIFDQGGFQVYDNGDFSRNQTTELLDRWQQAGDQADVPELRVEPNGRAFSSRWLQKADYLRIKRLRVGYALTQKWRDKFKLSQAEIFLQGENLWTFTALRNLDPELAGRAVTENQNRNLLFGVQNFVVPQALRVEVGVEIKF